MTKDFSISQYLYVEKSLISDVRLASLGFSAVMSNNDVRIELAKSDDQTINSQFSDYSQTFDELISGISPIRTDQVSLSISIRAYKYIPEISLSSALIQMLARARAEVDVDVINMIDQSEQIKAIDGVTISPPVSTKP